MLGVVVVASYSCLLPFYYHKAKIGGFNVNNIIICRVLTFKRREGAFADPVATKLPQRPVLLFSAQNHRISAVQASLAGISED